MEDVNETKVPLPQQGDIHIPLNQSNILQTILLIVFNYQKIIISDNILNFFIGISQ